MLTKQMSPSEWGSIRELDPNTKYVLSPGEYEPRIFRQSEPVEIVGDGNAILKGPVALIAGNWTFRNIIFQYSKADSREVLVDLHNGASNIIIDHCAFQHAGVGTGVRHDGLRAFFGTDSVHISNCIFTNCSRTWILAYGARNWSITDCVFDGCGSGDSSIHAGGIVFNDCGPNSGIVINNNTLKDLSGTEMVELKDSIQGGFTVTNNLFLQRPGFSGTGCSNGTIGNTGGDTLNDSVISGNCFYNITKGQSGFYLYRGSGNKMLNNTWVNCREPRYLFQDVVAEWPLNSTYIFKDKLFAEIPIDSDHFRQLLADSIEAPEEEEEVVEEEVVEEEVAIPEYEPTGILPLPLIRGVSYSIRLDPDDASRVIIGGQDEQ
jgi:hypothetical protein